MATSDNDQTRDPDNPDQPTETAAQAEARKRADLQREAQERRDQEQKAREDAARQEQEQHDPLLARDDFARTHSAAAFANTAGPVATNPNAPPGGPGPAEARDLKDSPANLQARIDQAQKDLDGLVALQQGRYVQEYPKVLYHDDHENPDATDGPVAPVTVASKEQEDEAKKHGWRHANPGAAMKSRRGSKTPDATEHTREDENARRDLPAQMALDQDARTGKPPVDAVVDSDAPDPGAPRSAAAGGQTTVAASPRSAEETTRDVKQAARTNDVAQKTGGSGTKKGGGQ